MAGLTEPSSAGIKVAMTARKAAGMLIALLGLAAAAFVAANAVDYFRFHGAIRRLESLTEEQFRALGDAAARVDRRLESAPGFEALQAAHASLAPGTSDFLLYELKPTKPQYEDDSIYLYARISISPSNQEIMYFTNSSGPQRSKVVWNRNPEFVRKHSPGGRILTVRQSTMSGSRSWIVLNDHILVVDDSGTVGGEPSIAGRATLDAAGLRRIQNAIAGLSTTALGKDYRDEGVLDGATVNLNFQPDGEGGPKDIQISNVWREEFAPLLGAVSELSPKDCPIEFIKWMKGDQDLHRRPTAIRTIQEWEAIYFGKPNLPWWCVWRRWLN